jgi:hypothetical protein
LANDVAFKNAFFCPAAVGLNEFNPLFLQDGYDLQLFGLLGDNDTYGDQAILNGLHGPVSFSLSQFAADTDGYRPNNDDSLRQYDGYGAVWPYGAQIASPARAPESGDLQRHSIRHSSARPFCEEDVVPSWACVRLSTHGQTCCYPSSARPAALTYLIRRLAIFDDGAEGGGSTHEPQQSRCDTAQATEEADGSDFSVFRLRHIEATTSTPRLYLLSAADCRRYKSASRMTADVGR